MWRLGSECARNWTIKISCSPVPLFSRTIARCGDQVSVALAGSLPLTFPWWTSPGRPTTGRRVDLIKTRTLQNMLHVSMRFETKRKFQQNLRAVLKKTQRITRANVV